MILLAGERKLMKFFVEFDLPLSTLSPSIVFQRSFTYREHVKAQLEQLLMIE